MWAMYQSVRQCIETDGRHWCTGKHCVKYHPLFFWSAELFFMKKEIQLLNIKENVPFYGQTCLRQDIILKNMHHVR